MPTYEYKCSACDHEFEQFQSMKDKPLKACPACKKPKLERLIGIGAAVLFKGSGFYQTDYRSESYKKGAEAEKPGGGADGKTGEAKAADTKPGESKTGESKTSESKPGESKSTESKGSDSKPASDSGKSESSAKSGARSESKPGAAKSGRSKAKG